MGVLLHILNVTDYTPPQSQMLMAFAPFSDVPHYYWSSTAILCSQDSFSPWEG